MMKVMMVLLMNVHLIKFMITIIIYLQYKQLSKLNGCSLMINYISLLQSIII